MVQTEHQPSRKKTRYGFMQEDGCNVWKHCLTCPLSACIYDNPRVILDMRDEVIGKLNAKGITVKSIAEQLLISGKTVSRSIKRNANRVEGQITRI